MTSFTSSSDFLDYPFFHNIYCKEGDPNITFTKICGSQQNEFEEN